ncbi:MAG TPA: hypothetical protein VGR84_15370 [Candidatus Acidoferrales bacterium]|nr:hypothetical protein [Candidatus Acidoferrales bacterium]
MKLKELALCIALAGLTASVGFARGNNNAQKSKSEVRTITGCLSQGDNAKEFTLTGENGSTWEIHSSRVALAKHVGHTVTVTGVVAHAMVHNMKEDAKDAAADADIKKNNTEHGHLTVTRLKMVSESCEK